MYNTGHENVFVLVVCSILFNLCAHVNCILQLPSSQVKCPGQTTLQGTMTPGARRMPLRAGITHHPLHIASMPMVAPTQANPLLPTRLM